MRSPSVHGVIRRRLLVNFRVDPAVAQRQLPERFRPKLHAGYAVAGICLIRLEDIRPRRFPRLLGLSSENAAHRFAIRWKEDDGGEREGVYIPRRDSSSVVNHVIGGRLFPGEHERAKFTVDESPGHIGIAMTSVDHSVSVRVAASEAAEMPAHSIFKSVAEASAFFEPGSLGYSATRDHHRLDGVVLRTSTWTVSPLEVQVVESSYFSDEQMFPKGSIEFDCALIMRDIAHEWNAAAELYL